MHAMILRVLTATGKNGIKVVPLLIPVSNAFV